VISLVSSPGAQLPQFFSPTSKTSGLVPLLSVLPPDTPYHHVLTFLVARSPAPGPECEFPRSFSNVSYLPRSDLGLLQQLEDDLSYDHNTARREVQADAQLKFESPALSSPGPMRWRPHLHP